MEALRQLLYDWERWSAMWPLRCRPEYRHPVQAFGLEPGLLAVWGKVFFEGITHTEASQLIETEEIREGPTPGRGFVIIGMLAGLAVAEMVPMISGRGGSTYCAMGPRVVLPEKVFTPIVSEIPPDAVDVIGIVLCVVVFDQKAGAVQSVVMGLSPL
jgi:hypothetical protein